MECKDQEKTADMEKPTEKSCHTLSLLQGDEQFFNRIISRDASNGFSSRIYFRSGEGIPFKWEVQPGKAKSQPETESIPPLSPPPAIQSAGLGRPCIDPVEPAKGLLWSKVWFWKKTRRSQPPNKTQTVLREVISDSSGSDWVEKLESYSSDTDSIASPRHSNASYLMSPVSSSSHGPSSSRFAAPRSQKGADFGGRGSIEDLDWRLRCSPWNFAGVSICVARRE
ncbi:PREDICTED: uncharacterized protein LOC104603170 [Nelumbo nucifera]|uniref:Uncharacterized protein LOC104603170 n=2 Tax=Nelumbo nucifera TaxID=4432 RepID=A0A1U8AR31_NELNU|nr:PREDICTED: uncharacterized protein LOC104603170 [Nelumbo nucifera]DAD45719.1 TPA_asm: hypothetical protein HUJ06_003949 [Nelumbo nucifera]